MTSTCNCNQCNQWAGTLPSVALSSVLQFCRLDLFFLLPMTHFMHNST